MRSTPPLRYRNITELRAAAVEDDTIVLLSDRAVKGDMLGAFYRWDASSTATDDTTHYAVVASSRPGITTGRWVRIFSMTRVIAQGEFTVVAGMKVLHAELTTDGAGEITLNLTENNTPTGAALFAKVLYATADAADFAKPVTVTRKATATAKTIAFALSQANTSLVTILGLQVLGGPAMIPLPAGVKVLVRIEGR